MVAALKRSRSVAGQQFLRIRDREEAGPSHCQDTEPPTPVMPPEELGTASPFLRVPLSVSSQLGSILDCPLVTQLTWLCPVQTDGLADLGPAGCPSQACFPSLLPITACARKGPGTSIELLPRPAENEGQGPWGWWWHRAVCGSGVRR